MSDPKKSLPRRPRSVVWYYFDKVPNEPFSAKCKLCLSVCHHAMNTSNLFKHLKVKHPTSFKEAEEQREQEMDLYLQLKAKAGKPVTKHIRGRGRPKGSPGASSSKDLTSPPMAIIKSESEGLIKNSFSPASLSGMSRKSFAGMSGGGVSKSRNQNLSRALLRMLARDMLHPAMVTGRGFREFLSACDVRMEVPAKKTINKTLMPELVEETKLRMKVDILMASSLALSVESWLYKESQSFVTITTHFIKDSWTICSLVLETFDCTDERTETNMATQLKRVTDEWGITERVMALVSDIPDETLSSASLVNGWEELTCFGHTVNRIVTDALASVSEIVRIQKKAYDAVSFFDVSVKASDTLSAVQQQHGLPVHRLKQERGSDWTSVFGMFSRMVEQYEAVNTVLCFLARDHMCLCDDEVELIRGVVQTLKPFQAATQELCTEPYTCLSKLIPIATLLQQVISAGMASSITTSPSSGPQAALKNALVSQMQQQFSGLENSSILSAATLLDPRFKQHAFTDSAALEAAQQRLIQDTQAVVQSFESLGKSKSSIPAVPVTTAPSVDTSASFWGMFDKKVVDAGAMKTDVSEAENEARRFFKEVNIPRSADPLNWWRLNEVQFPHLKVLARKFLAVPATAVPSNRLFTKEGLEFSSRRERLRPGEVHNMVFLNQNLN